MMSTSTQDTTINKIQSLCGFVCILPLLIYAIYVGKKFAKDPNKQCVEDATWLFVYGILGLSTQVVALTTTFLNKPSEQPSVLFKIFAIMFLLCTLAGLGWSIYGIELFFTEPICQQKEVHLYGKILAWISVIAFTIVGSLGIICVPLLLMTGSLG